MSGKLEILQLFIENNHAIRKAAMPFLV